MAAIARFTASWVSNLAAKLVYSTVEGYAFLFSKYGASVILGAEAALLLRVAGPQRILGTGLQAATACIIGRGIWAFFHATHASQACATAMKEETNSKISAVGATAVAAASAASAATQSIWDWEPPSGDQLSSGAWHVLRELVVTATKMQNLYPEVSTLMASPELARPEELTSRLYYLYVASEKAGVSEYDFSDAQPVPESTLDSLRAMRPYASFAYDCTSDVMLSDSLAGKGFRLLAAKYEPDLTSGCPAYYLAMSNSKSPLPKITSPTAVVNAENSNTDGDGGDGDDAKTSNKEVILCIRGTYSPEDVFTDLLMVGVAFGGDTDDEDGEEGTDTSDEKKPKMVFNAHAGMAKGALFLVKKFGAMLCSLRDAGVKVTLIGHSLGAGVASMVALILKQKKYGFNTSNLQCFAFEPPACLDLPLAQECADVVISMVHADDIVPRLAVGPFTTFLKELAQFDWHAEEKKEGNALPTPLAVMHKLAGLIGSKSVAESAAEAEVENKDQGADVEKKEESKYNPFVPGKIVFICSDIPEPEKKETSQIKSEEESTTITTVDRLADAKAVRVLLEPASPILRRIRLTSTLVSDHFIDSTAFLTALGERGT